MSSEKSLTNTDTAEAGALDGITVVDFSTDIRGMYCTKLLADLGATVIQIEPPGVTLSVARNPFMAASRISKRVQRLPTTR